MRFRIVGSLLLLAAGFVTLSLTWGQDRPVPPAGQPYGGSGPAPDKTAGRTISPAATAAAAPARDFSRLPPFVRLLLLSSQRGADWLYCMNGVKGRFLYGYLPALKAGLEGDHYLHQVGAALALARAARLTGEERYAVRATQALLTLLDETTSDPRDANVRHTMLPSAVVNRLGAAGLLVLAVHELPNPPADLVEKAEQLCNFIRHQARGDGSLICDDDRPPVGYVVGQVMDDPASMNEYPGLALHALARSHKLRPAPWKIDMVRKALAYYRPWWQTHKSREFVPAQTAAYAEAYLATKDKAFAEFVFEMNDWLCELQYVNPDPRHPLWNGGFMTWSGGSKIETAPQIDSACCAESLAHASQVTRDCADVTRHQRYGEGLEHCLQFLSTLQYTEANTQHYADWYRPRLLGAFCASHQDGNLRIDYTQHALSAMALYVEGEMR
jgi:hypothetical protein